MILVTGGAGFIGSHLVEALVRDGEAVRVLDDLSTGHRENLAAVAADVELVEAGVQDPAAMRAALAGVTAVVHLAACPSVARSLEEPLAVHEQNATGTLVAVAEAGRAGVRRLVFASSSALYGGGGEAPAREAEPVHPLSPYGAQKLLGEHYCRILGAHAGLETVALRFFNVFGPRQDPGSPYSGVISLFCRALLRGTAPEIHGDGGQVRDFVYVDDVVRAIRAALTAPAAAGATCNVATGRSRTILELYETLARLTGTTAPPWHGPARPGDVRHSVADVTRAREVLGFRARVDFEEGLARTLEWCRRKELP